MTFSRANALGWALYETFLSSQANTVDINQSRAVDGHAGGTYNPSASITLNNQLQVDSTGAAAANVVGIVATGKGNEAGIDGTGGTTNGIGIKGTGGTTNGIGVYGYGSGSGAGVYGVGGGADGEGGYFEGGATNGNGVVALGAGAAPMITETDAGLLAYGGTAGGKGVYALGVGAHAGVTADGGTTNAAGVDGTGGGAGIGVKGTGGGGGGRGVAGYGTGSSDGVYGLGGATNGLGVVGAGQGSGQGVKGTGGGTVGIGVEGQGGAGGGTGVKGSGGAGGGIGVSGYGNTASSGVYGEGGTSDGWGGHFVGGTTNGGGVIAQAKGTGTAVSTFRDAGGSNLRLEGEATDPTSPAEGDIWFEDTDDEFVAYAASRKHQLLDTWALGTITGGGAPGVSDQNNVSGITSNATSVTVNFSRSFGSANIAPVITVGGAGIKVFPVISTLNAGYVTFQMYEDDGTLVVPTAGATNLFFGIIVKGCL